MQRALELFAKQRTVRKIGQRVVASHVRDLRLRLLPLRDVLEGRNPAAGFHRLGDNPHRPSALLQDPGRAPAGLCIRNQPGEELLGRVSVPATGRILRLQDVEQQSSPQFQIRPSEHRHVALVEQQDAAFGVEHAQALRHVLQRRVEQHLLSLQRALAATIHRGHRQRDDENDDGGASNQERQRRGRYQHPLGHERWIGNQRDRAHPGEMMRDDGDRQQQGGGSQRP